MRDIKEILADLKRAQDELSEHVEWTAQRQVEEWRLESQVRSLEDERNAWVDAYAGAKLGPNEPITLGELKKPRNIRVKPWRS